MSKKAYITCVLPILALSLLTSCVATKRDVVMLNRQIQTMNDQMSNLGKVRENQADVAAETVTLRQELQRISGLLEETRHMVTAASEKDAMELEALQARLTAIEEKMAQVSSRLGLEPLTETETGATGMPPAGTGGITPQGPGSEEMGNAPENRIYDSALAVYREGRLDEAATAFENFVSQYPRSPLADNAQFWIGECYMAMKKYDLAIKAYHEVEVKYPQGNKIPGAMLKQALAFLELGDVPAAKYLLNKLIKQYPGSDESRIAESKLRTLN